MTTPRVDTETHALLSDADKVKGMLDSEGWAIAKTSLDALILDLQNINNLDLSTTDTAMFDLKSRKMASEILFQWQKGLYSTVEQNAANAAGLIDKKEKEGFIDRNN